MTYEPKETNRVEETIFKKESVNLKVKFYWNSHGTLVEFTGPNDKKTFSRKNIKVEIVKVQRNLEDTPFETWDLFVNDERMEGSVYRYSYIENSNNLNIKLVVGWG